MIAVDFMHHKNPPTWAGAEPTTLGAEGRNFVSTRCRTWYYRKRPRTTRMSCEQRVQHVKRKEIASKWLTVAP
ncbi:hypothetical protein TNCV_5038421 [Trichonephila clavipes]|nr:hypothetical protein TNCV_5038421 [Trichonephila clavipes]